MCDARADLKQQVDDLAALTPATATADGVEENLNAIEDDLNDIKDAQPDLSEERKQEVESATQSFTSEVEAIAADLGSSLSASGAEAQLRTARPAAGRLLQKGLRADRLRIGAATATDPRNTDMTDSQAPEPRSQTAWRCRESARCEYELGFPTPETSRKLFDEMDFQRAVQAYLWGYPAVSFESIRLTAKRDLGMDYNDLGIADNFVDPKSVWLTANDTTIYAFVNIDVAQGPVVIEIPPGAIVGLLDDFWQRSLVDVGLPGPDAGNGGKFLLLPPGYDGEVPRPATTHFGQRCTTTTSWSAASSSTTTCPTPSRASGT